MTAVEGVGSPAAVEHHYPDGSYDVDWAAPPADDEREALARMVGMVMAERMSDEWMSDLDFESMRDEIVHLSLAAGFRRQGPITDEWEYGSKGYCFDWDDRRCRDTASTLAEIIAHEDEMHGGNASHPVRRRPAGPWEPVEAARDV